MVQFLKNVAVESVMMMRYCLTASANASRAIGDPTPAFPANPAFALPEVVPTGIYQRLIELVDRIRSAPAYTDEIGALLGIIPSTPAPSRKPT